MSHVLVRGPGGTVALPERRTIMIDRLDGGQLVVNPPRRVWDRTALDATELTQWNFLVAATAAAMLETLPQLRDGCVNYWDAGNWALHPEAPPEGRRLVANIASSISTWSDAVPARPIRLGPGASRRCFRTSGIASPGRTASSRSPPPNVACWYRA